MTEGAFCWWCRHTEPLQQQKVDASSKTHYSVSQLCLLLRGCEVCAHDSLSAQALKLHLAFKQSSRTQMSKDSTAACSNWDRTRHKRDLLGSARARPSPDASKATTSKHMTRRCMMVAWAALCLVGMQCTLRFPKRIAGEHCESLW